MANQRCPSPLHPQLPALEVAQEHGGEGEEEQAGDEWQQQSGDADDGTGGDGEQQQGLHEQRGDVESAKGSHWRSPVFPLVN